jgi:NAD(P)-dependent dehydrogenase (short-subunit alcohol dehydrogenase family)
MTVHIDPDEFTGHIALVTGAAGGGIGQATATRLAAGGATVVVTDSHGGRTEQVTRELRTRFGVDRIHGEVLDCGDMNNIQRVVDMVTKHVGPVTILVNNAALNIIAPVWDYKLEDWRRVMAVNIDGPWYLCRLTMPVMRAEGGGTIVNIGSYAPDVGGGGIEAPYASSKGALAALTRGLAHEGGPYKIRANFVSMGMVRGTRFIDRHPELLEQPDALGPLGALPEADDIAEAVAFLASDRAAYITGEIVNVSGGAYMRT